MTEQELEQALRKALPPLHPESNLVERICVQLDSNAERRADSHRHWLPAAIAATVLIAFGFAQWAERQHQRQVQVRAQLLQGLTIASSSLREARNAVLQSEDSAP
jgi:hypothetical protein